MLIERPPLLYRLLFPEAIWRLKKRGRKVVYLTFDDGPTPGITEWILATLDKYDAKATFFVLGKNVGLDTLNTLLADMQPAQKPLDLVRPAGGGTAPSAPLTWDKATPEQLADLRDNNREE